MNKTLINMMNETEIEMKNEKSWCYMDDEEYTSFDKQMNNNHTNTRKYSNVNYNGNYNSNYNKPQYIQSIFKNNPQVYGKNRYDRAVIRLRIPIIHHINFEYDIDLTPFIGFTCEMLAYTATQTASFVKNSKIVTAITDTTKSVYETTKSAISSITTTITSFFKIF